MPKQRITKEMILDTAFTLTREQGFEHVITKEIAERIGCSVQPIYSYYKNMEELKRDLFHRAVVFYSDFISRNAREEKSFRSVGYAQIQFAREEPHLFWLLFMMKQDSLNSFEDIYEKRSNKKVTEQIAEEYQIPSELAKALHLNMLVYTHGISSMLVTNSVQLEDVEIRNMLDAAFDAFLRKIRDNSVSEKEMDYE